MNIRELTRHFASYLNVVKRGERVVVMVRSVPVADLIPRNSNLASPAWRRSIQKIRVTGETLSRTVSRLRDGGRRARSSISHL